MEDNCYELLGVEKDAGGLTIKRAYRKLALRLHPDKCDHPFALPAMQALNLAYDKATGKEEEAKKAAAAAAKKGAAARGRPGARR